MFLGIDPGWKNLGIASFSATEELVTKVTNPSTSKTLYKAIGEVLNTRDYPSSSTLCMERYVAYNGVHNADSEYILMTIGALTLEAQRRGWSVFLVRAIDWKPKLCKMMFKERDFRNPSQSFDKGYSVAMAKFLFPSFTGTDHEADAVCLAYLGSRLQAAADDSVKKGKRV